MTTPDPQVTPPLDSALYAPREDELVLLKNLTGINNEEELKKHVLEVQAEAYKVYPYPCIRTFNFVTFKIARYPWYEDILKLGKERPGAVYLELACCFGNDARKLISDGYPIENVLASDLRKDYWDISHKFYKSTPETYPVPFIQGDVFDPSFIAAEGPMILATSESSVPPSAAPPSIKSVTSLIPLQHHISVIHAAYLFHLFNKEEQSRLARLVASLLSPLPESMIVGSHRGIPDGPGAEGVQDENGGTRLRNAIGTEVFAHSPTSWRKLWVGDEGIFKEGDVHVTSIIVERQRWDVNEAFGYKDATIAYWHNWQVIRV